MALSPTDRDTFAREVDDAVREDRVKSLFATYGRIIGAAVVAGLLALGGWLYWQNHQEAQAGERGRQMIAAMNSLQANRARAAAGAVEPLVAGDDAAYRAAARMLQGSIAESEQNAEQAAQRFGAVASDADAPRELRDFAMLRQTLVQFDTLEPEAIVARLRTLVSDRQGPLYPLAAELTALAELRRNNQSAAATLYGRIAEHEDAPESLKERASQMAAALRASSGAPAARPAAAPAPRTASEPATKE